MAGVNLRTIAEGIQTILAADAAIIARGTPVEIEPDWMMAIERGSLVAIYPDRWDAPANMQRIAAGTRMDKRIKFSLWVASGMLDLAEASKLRDGLQADVERCLMANRTLGGTVIASWIDGGEYLTVGPGNQSFCALVEIGLVCDAIATTA